MRYRISSISDVTVWKMKWSNSHCVLPSPGRIFFTLDFAISISMAMSTKHYYKGQNAISSGVWWRVGWKGIGEAFLEVQVRTCVTVNVEPGPNGIKMYWPTILLTVHANLLYVLGRPVTCIQDVCQIYFSVCESFKFVPCRHNVACHSQLPS